MKHIAFSAPVKIMFLALLVFSLLTALTTTAWTAALDRQVLQLLRSRPIDVRDTGPLWFMEFMRDLTSLAGVGVVVVVALLVLIHQLLGGAWRAAVVTLVVVAGTHFCTDVLKEFIARPRPDLVEHGTRVFTHSYPSGHSSMAAAIALTLAWYTSSLQTHRTQRVYCWVVGVGAVILIGFTRMALGVHWLSDVAAGWCVGVFWAAAGFLVARTLGCHKGRGIQ